VSGELLLPFPFGCQLMQRHTEDAKQREENERSKTTQQVATSLLTTTMLRSWYRQTKVSVKRSHLFSLMPLLADRFSPNHSLWFLGYLKKLFWLTALVIYNTERDHRKCWAGKVLEWGIITYLIVLSQNSREETEENHNLISEIQLFQNTSATSTPNCSVSVTH